MVLSDEERQAKKAAQLARIAAKGSKEYTTLYAQQPAQIAKAARLAAEKAVEREAKSAFSSAAVQDAEGAVAVFATASSLNTKGSK